MSISLAEALQQVQLEAGKTYRYETAEHMIEVRVRKRESEPMAIPAPESAATPEPDVMLEPWVELPDPPAVAIGWSKLAEPLPPSCLISQQRSHDRPGRVQPLYREHLAKHFADTYSRIGLPEPYPTE